MMLTSMMWRHSEDALARLAGAVMVNSNVTVFPAGTVKAGTEKLALASATTLVCVHSTGVRFRGHPGYCACADGMEL